MNTLAILEPPKKPPLVAVGYSDDIRDLGDRIANLTMKEAKELSEYLDKGINERKR